MNYVTHYDLPEEVAEIEMPNYKSASEALENILDELYNSYNDINKKKLRSDFAFLCRELNVNSEYSELLIDEHGLCVEHYKEKYRYNERRSVSQINQQ